MSENTKSIDVKLTNTKKKVRENERFEVEILDKAQLNDLLPKTKNIEPQKYFRSLDDIAHEFGSTYNTIHNILNNRAQKFKDIIKIYHIDTEKNRVVKWGSKNHTKEPEQRTKDEPKDPRLRYETTQEGLTFGIKKEPDQEEPKSLMTQNDVNYLLKYNELKEKYDKLQKDYNNLLIHNNKVEERCEELLVTLNKSDSDCDNEDEITELRQLNHNLTEIGKKCKEYIYFHEGDTVEDTFLKFYKYHRDNNTHKCSNCNEKKKYCIILDLRDKVKLCWGCYRVKQCINSKKMTRLRAEEDDR